MAKVKGVAASLLPSGLLMLVIGLAILGIWADAAEPGENSTPTDPPAAAGAQATVLSAGCLWRKHYTYLPVRLSEAAAQSAGLALDKETRRKALVSRVPDRVLDMTTPAPPPDWIEAGFDDAGWGQGHGHEFTGVPVELRHITDTVSLATLRGTDPFVLDIGFIAMRGKFLVKDAAKVKRLTLSLAYRGGFAAYLNGKEIARASLPPGKLETDTPAQDYPLDAFLAPPDDKGQRHALIWYNPRIGKWLADLKLQYALRERSFGPLEVDPKLLRDGLNVLALEFHRSDFPDECRKAGLAFAPLGLSEVFLSADAPPDNFVNSTVRPPGIQIWNAELWACPLNTSFGDPTEKLSPLRIVAARNGIFSGQVVVGSTNPIQGLSASVGPLRSAAGAEIPAAAVKVRFLTATPPYGGEIYTWDNGIGGIPFDSISDQPPVTVMVAQPKVYLENFPPYVHNVARFRRSQGLPEKTVDGAVLPVWVTVHVPAAAPAGTYTGKLTLAAKDAPPIQCPIELEVAGFTLPDVKDYVSALSIYQSPDTLATIYKVPLWSERHWELIEQSLQWMGGVGNHSLILPLLSKEQGGNEESYVHWIKQKDGSYKHDFTVMDRYLDLFLKTHDKQRIKAVCLIAHGAQSGAPNGQATVTLLDPEKGTKSDLKLPCYGTPEAEALLKPLLEAVRENLKKRGLLAQVQLGMPTDPGRSNVTPAVAAMFNRLLPGAGWFAACHNPNTAYCDGAPVFHIERVYCGPLEDPARKRLFGWQLPRMELAFTRYGFEPAELGFGFASAWRCRMAQEAILAAGFRGAGRLGADYWRAMPGVETGGGNTYYSRYAASGVYNLGASGTCCDLLAPGPKGPVTTRRLENLREGIQTAETVIFLQKALLDKKVPEELEKQCWNLLDERINAYRTFRPEGGQERDRKLYQMAARISQVLSGIPKP